MGKKGTRGGAQKNPMRGGKMGNGGDPHYCAFLKAEEEDPPWATNHPIQGGKRHWATGGRKKRGQSKFGKTHRREGGVFKGWERRFFLGRERREKQGTGEWAERPRSGVQCAK